MRVNEGVVLLRRRQLLPLLQTGLRDCEAAVRSAAAKALATLGPQVGQNYVYLAVDWCCWAWGLSYLWLRSLGVVVWCLHPCNMHEPPLPISVRFDFAHVVPVVTPESLLRVLCLGLALHRGPSFSWWLCSTIRPLWSGPLVLWG